MKVGYLLVALAFAGLIANTNALFGLTVRRFYVAGTFSVAYNGTTANPVQGSVGYVSSFDGTSWSTFAGGADGKVNVVHVDTLFNVYIGGNFQTAGGVATGPLALWKRNTNAWVAVGNVQFTIDAADGTWLGPSTAEKGIYAIKTDCLTANSNGCDVYVGGLFKSTPEGATGTCSNVCKYDSASAKWNNLGGTGTAGTTGAGHGLTPVLANRVNALWKKQASCTLSNAGLTATAGVACNLWIGGAFPQLWKIYNPTNSAGPWFGPASTQAVSDGASSVPSATWAVNSIFYQSFTFANDEVYIGGNFDFLTGETGSTNRCKHLCRIKVTNSKSTPTFALSRVGAATGGPDGAVSSVFGVPSGTAQLVKTSNPATDVYVSGLFTATPSILKASSNVNGDGTWGPVTINNDAAVGQNVTKSIWVCGITSLECERGSILVGGGSVNAYVRYFNAKDQTWNDLAGGLGTGQVLSVDSQNAGSTNYLSFSCIMIVLVAMFMVAF